MSEERLREILPELRNLIAFFREYPDIFVDFVKGPESKFKFYTYQRIFLRAACRHRYFYGTFPRAFSKSFLTVLLQMIRCTLYPGIDVFVSTGGKEQAASITLQKVSEIESLIPAFANEINHERGASKTSKDSVSYIWKNGSKLGNMPATESSRGQRRTAGVLEEAILIDQDALNEILIPTMNVDRLLPDGTRHPEEIINQSQVYITTAGFRESFAFKKLKELFVRGAIDQDEVMVMGGTYQIPVKEGLLKETFVDDLRSQDTFREESFDREYNSRWSGASEDAFFTPEIIDKNRVLKQAETTASERKGKHGYYIMSVDVGRFGCTTEACIWKINPQEYGQDIKNLVNIYSFEAEHFGIQSIHLKRLYYQYKCQSMVVDGNGVGAGLVDFLVISNEDPETGDMLPPFGVENDDDGKYKAFRTQATELNALYIIKANAGMNSEMYSYAKSQLSAGKVNLLIDETEAKTNLLATQVGRSMSTPQRYAYLKPYAATTTLREELLNLVESTEGLNIVLKRSSKSIKKDKFSAFIYGLHYVHMQEDLKKRRKKRKMSSLMLFN
jgi:hypothetical protein